MKTRLEPTQSPHISHDRDPSSDLTCFLYIPHLPTRISNHSQKGAHTHTAFPSRTSTEKEKEKSPKFWTIATVPSLSLLPRKIITKLPARSSRLPSFFYPSPPNLYPLTQKFRPKRHNIPGFSDCCRSDGRGHNKGECFQ